MERTFTERTRTATRPTSEQHRKLDQIFTDIREATARAVDRQSGRAYYPAPIPSADAYADAVRDSREAAQRIIDAIRAGRFPATIETL
jgi:hypothetical protein